MSKARIVVRLLGLSAAGFAALVAHESFTSNAVIPIPGDRPTYGFGSTFKEDGSPVRMGDTITPPAAVRLSVSHIAKDEAALKRCVTGDMSPKEWDILVNFSYWRGAGGTCRSEVVKNINAGRYADACASYLLLDSRKAAGKDCAIPENRCRGVWLRAQERHAQCMAAQ
ncbi:glycoside hydrolase family protein [Paucibacter sp. O1-1]|nr:glycoside hydrolase family protein [Paucibacter sp. O1-1]MCU7374960.1 glycoside hydrolase family protein [Paucibacter sp. O1-1]MDA3827876.1 glycoside hydrolase family protein [Paucibacter sp. O1-1]MDA3829962.1 glycoside hydrolase family protein [Paucibacter sp. O1-1]